MKHLLACVGLGLCCVVVAPCDRVAAARIQELACRRDFQGIEYCTTDNGETHIVRVDLTNRHVRFDVATASNAKGPNPPSWSASYRQTVAQMAEAHPVLQDTPLAVAITADYGAGDGSHGWEGFMVQRGQRLDGPGVNAPDCDCTFYERSALTLSKSKPTQVTIGRHSPSEFAQYDLYASKCAGDAAFAACKADFLQRTPTPDEQRTYEQRLRDAWYTTVGGGPLIVRNGQPILISQACREERFKADWCSDTPNVTPERLRQLRMGSVAGVTGDGKQLILIVTMARLPNELSQLLAEQGAETGIRFDGSESAQIWYDGAERTGNTRRISNALLVYAARVPELAASPTSALFYDVVVAGETAQLAVEVRNEGRATWSSPAYELAQVGGNLSTAPTTLSLHGPVSSGDTIGWQIEAPTSGAPALRSLRYQMRHNGQPFGEVITAYVIILPEQLRDAEQRIRDQVEQWRRQGEQKVDELMDQIWQSIQEELERQAQGMVDRLIGALCGQGSAVIFTVTAVMISYRRRLRWVE